MGIECYIAQLYWIRKKKPSQEDRAGTRRSWLEGRACQPGQTHQNQPRSRLNKAVPCIGVCLNKLFFYGLLWVLAEKGMIKAVYWNSPAAIPSCPKTEFPMRRLEQSLFSVLLLHFMFAWLLKVGW